MANDVAVQLLYDNLAALPSAEYGVINMLPFAHDTETTRTVKRQVCEAIVELFETNGLLNHEAPQVEPLESREVRIKCVRCQNELVNMPTSIEGVSFVDAGRLIGIMASLNTECPHSVRTMDDLRQKMEREFLAEVEADEAQSKVKDE